MDKLLNSCKIGIISMWIVVFLVACGKTAPSSVRSTYTHDAIAGLKKKRSADLMDILSNMLLDHSAGVQGSDWPNYGNIFDNDYPMDDWMANEIPQVDYGNIWSDYGDRYGGLKENVDLNPPDSLDYSCSEEENNDIVPFVESGYQYNKRPENSDWNSNDRDFVVIKPDVEDTYRSRHESDFEYGTNGGPVYVDWNRTPSRGYPEIDETLWRQFDKPQVNEGFAPAGGKSTPPVASGKEAKFNIFTCLSGSHQLAPETKNIADEYLVLLIKKDHILGAKNEGNGNRNHQTGQGTSKTTTETPSKAEEKSNSTQKTTEAAVVSTTLSVHSDVTVRPFEEDDCNRTIATEIPSLSATGATFGTEVPSSSTASTMTVVATEGPSLITVHVPNSTTATESPSTTKTPVRTSTMVVTSTPGRPNRTTSYTPSSKTTRKSTEIRPSTTTTARTTQSLPTFTTADSQAFVTKAPSTTAPSTTETTESPPAFTISSYKVSLTAAGTTEIPATTTSHIQSNNGPPSGYTSQSSSKTTPITNPASESTTTHTMPTPKSTKATEIPISTTKTSHLAPADSESIPTDGATIDFSKPTTEKNTITTVATIISTIGDAVAETTLPPTTIAQAITEMPSLSTAQIGIDPEGIVENGQQYLPQADAKTDAQTLNNLDDINEEPSTTPLTTSTEESWTYVE